MGIETLRVQFSGGASNADPVLSEGGVISSVDVKSQSVSMAALGGITIADAAGNPEGVGLLKFYPSTSTVTWTPPGSLVAGDPVSLPADGTYLVRGAGSTAGYVIITVVFLSLPPSGTWSMAATVATLPGGFLPAVDKDASYLGTTQYFLYYVKNTGAATIRGVTVTLPSYPTMPDVLSIALAAAVNTQEVQGDAAAKTYLPLLTIGDLAAGDYYGLWVKRLVPFDTVTPITARSLSLTINALT